MPAVHRLLNGGACVHAHLEWWSLEDWVGSPAFIVLIREGNLEGVSLAMCDETPTAWWRMFALSELLDLRRAVPTTRPSLPDDTQSKPHGRWPTPNGPQTGPLRAALETLLEPTLAGLRPAGVRTLVCLTWGDWPEAILPTLGFTRLTQVITLRKEDRRVPPLDQRHTVIRPATPLDLPAVVGVDQAAFDALWCYGPRTVARLQQVMAHMIVAERGGTIIGYACGELYSSSGHVVRLAVHPACQRQNVGALLLAHIIRLFFAAGAQAITLNTQVDNTVSQKLYRQFNFRTVGSPTHVWQRPVMAKE